MDALTVFLRTYPPQTEEVIAWDHLRLVATSSLCTELPPDELITSVRAIVCDGQRLLLVRDPDGVHILPGGRRERDETLEQTLCREVLEETGWEVEQVRLLGIIHFHHLTSKPPEYAYPYPDFLHVIYRAVPLRYRAEARQSDGYELGAEMVPLASREQLALSAREQMLLTAATRSRA
jgi:ADP-ribose pyrophosphatase YjhB (NUDIX family)